MKDLDLYGATNGPTANGTWLHILRLGDEQPTEEDLDELTGRLDGSEVTVSRRRGVFVEPGDYDRIIKENAKRSDIALRFRKAGIGDHGTGTEAEARVVPSAEHVNTQMSPGMDNARIRQLVSEGHLARVYKDDAGGLQQPLNSYDSQN